MTQEQFEQVAACAYVHLATVSLCSAGFRIEARCGLREITKMLTYTEVFHSHFPSSILCDAITNTARELRART